MTDFNEQKGIANFGALLLARYPGRSFMILSSFLAAGLMEGISAGALLPLLAKMGATGAAQASDQDGIILFFNRVFSILNIEQGIGSLLALIIGLFFIKAILQFFAMREVGNATASMTAELRKGLITSLMRARWSYFTSLSTGKIVNSLISEADRAALSYLHLCKMLADIIIVIIYLIIALFISWQATIAAIGGGFILMVALHRLIAMVKSAAQEQTRLFRTLSSLIADALVSFKPIKAMGREEYFRKLLNRDTQSLWAAKKKEVIGTELMSSARDPLLVCLVAAGMYGSYAYAGLSLSSLLVLAFMFLRVVQKLTFIQQGYQRVASQESAYWAIMDSMHKADAAQENLAGMKKPEFEKTIRFENVVFSHARGDGGQEKILNQLSCVFPARRLNAIIGPSGSGKTTLLDIILGFYEPAEGRIYIDDAPLKDLDVAAWREKIGYVPQEGFLLHDTVWNNITLGQDISTEQAEAALKDAGIYEFIKGLPQGLRTMAGERGQMFSGGQRQRITLARALARRPSLLLMDEPTSALDADTEAQLLLTLKSLARDITIIVISHSEKVKSCADNVYFLDKGRITSPGTAGES